MKKLIILILLWSGLTTIAGAQDLSLYFMDGIWQKTLVAPGHVVKDHRWSLGLTGIGGHFFYNGPALADWGSINNGILTLSPEKALNAIQPENNFSLEYTYETFHIAHRLNDRWSLSLHHSSHTLAEMSYPGDLARLMAYGNGSFLNQEMNVGIGINYTSYSELAFGAIYSIGTWDLGGRVGLLFGGRNLQTKSHDLSLYTYDDYYQVRLKGDYQLTSSGIPSLTRLSKGAFGGLFKTFIPGSFSNLGLSLSLGASFHPTDVLTINFSMKDLGFIHWSKLARTYDVKGEWNIEGVDVFNAGSFDTSSLKNIGFNDVSNWIDSIKGLLNPDGPTLGSYNTSLPAKFTLSGSYRLTDKFTVGALYRYVNGILLTDNQLAIDATYNLFNIWQLGTMYSVFQGKQSIGLHSNLDLGPIQIYLASDKLISIGGKGKKYLHIRGGINVAL